ncbi:hypothetical protein Taro_052538, partial [Colocasia esculenta]|nr:hypothetical protein [Colocasia esculenta]
LQPVRGSPFGFLLFILDVYYTVVSLIEFFLCCRNTKARPWSFLSLAGRREESWSPTIICFARQRHRRDEDTSLGTKTSKGQLATIHANEGAKTIFREPPERLHRNGGAERSVHISSLAITVGPLLLPQFSICTQVDGKRSFRLPRRGGFEVVTSLPASDLVNFDIVSECFISHFSYMATQVPTLPDLVAEKMRPDEDFVTFANRWRSIASRADLPIPESQAITMIVTNTTPLLRFILMPSEYPSFAHLYNRARVVQNQIKDSSLPPFFEGKPKGRKAPMTPTTEGVTVNESVSACIQPLRPPNKPSNPTSNPHQFPSHPSMPYSAVHPPSGHTHPGPKRSHYPALPEFFGDIFFSLISCDAIQLPPQKKGVHPRADTSKYSPYHRALGHEIHNCFTFSDWVYDMNDQGRINWVDVKVAISESSSGLGHTISAPHTPFSREIHTGKALAITSPPFTCCFLCLSSWSTWSTKGSKTQARVNQQPSTPMKEQGQHSGNLWSEYTATGVTRGGHADEDPQVSAT